MPNPLTREAIIEAMARAWCEQYIREEHQMAGVPVNEDDLRVQVDMGWCEFKATAACAFEALGKLAAVVLREASPELLNSMALRYDHGVFAPPCSILGETQESKDCSAEATVRTMRQLHEEVVGTGFYRNADLTRPAQPDNPFHVRAADLTRERT